jgi:hypothetical protein
MTKYLHQDSSVFQTMDITWIKKNGKITFKPPKLLAVLEVAPQTTKKTPFVEIFP